VQGWKAQIVEVFHVEHFRPAPPVMIRVLESLVNPVTLSYFTSKARHI
jgi:hypothetical protein